MSNSLENRVSEIYEEWLKRFNKSLIDQPITATVYYSIFKYQGESGITAKQLAKILNMNVTAIYHHIKKLEEAQLLIVVDDPLNPSRKRYFDNRPDVVYTLLERNYGFGDSSLPEQIKDLITNPASLEAFKHRHREYINDRFKDGGKKRFKEIADIRRSISIISSAAMEADKNLANIPEDEFSNIIDEEPFVITVFADHNQYHNLIQKIRKEIITFINEIPSRESNYQADHETMISNSDRTRPFSLSIMGLPSLIDFRQDAEEFAE